MPIQTVNVAFDTLPHKDYYREPTQTLCWPKSLRARNPVKDPLHHALRSVISGSYAQGP